MPDVDVIGAETMMAPAAVRLSVVAAPPVLAIAEDTVMSPLSPPLEPVWTCTEVPALSVAEIAAASTVAPLAPGVKLPPL